MATSELTADHVVVGSGIVATSIALELAEQSGSVVLVAELGDRRGMASAAAGAMLGVFSEAGADETEERRDAEAGERLLARRRYDQWLASLRTDDGTAVTSTPGLAVIGNAVGDDDRRALAAIRGAAAAAGGAVEDLDPRDIDGYRPADDARPLEAILLADEGVVDTAALLDALVCSLRAHPQVRIVDDRGDALDGRAVTTRGGQRVAGGDVVLAPGAGGSILDDPVLGLPAVFAGRGTSALVRTSEPGPSIAIRTPNRAFACGVHALPRQGGCTYLGATNRLSTAAELDHQPTIDEIQTVLGGARRELDRHLGAAALVSVHVGHRPVTADRLPLVGRTEAPGVLVATGTYRNGILLAPRIAELIAAEIATPGSLDDHRWRPNRPVRTPSLEDLLATGVDGLVNHLDDGRRDELRGLVLATLQLALGEGGGDDDRRVKAANRLLQRAPMPEVLPLVLDLLSRPR